MPNIKFFLDTFSDDISRTELAEGWEDAGGKLTILESQPTYEGRRTYLIDHDDAIPKTAVAGAGALFVFCGGSKGSWPKGSSAVFVKTSLARVFNAIDSFIEKQHAWEAAFAALDSTVEFQKVVSLAADLGGCPTVMINDVGKIICSALLRKSTGFSEDSSIGALPIETGAKLIASSMNANSTDAIDFKTEWGTTMYCHRIMHPDATPSIMVMEDMDGSCDIATLCALAAEALGRISRNESLKVVHDEMRSFLRCWDDIMDMKISTTVAVRDAISRLPHKVDDFVSLAVIAFPNRREKIPYRNILLQLRRFFSDENITLYQRDIVIMLSQKERTFRPNFQGIDVDELSKFLIENDAMMAVTSKTRRVDALPSLYSLAKKTAMLAAALNDTPSQSHIVYYEDYSIYCIIDLAIKQYLQDPPNHDVVYLVHSAIIQLTRYDAEHHTDLRDVLYHYLMCDRNLVKTAQATFMHRNTVLNKINKITNLLQLDLEDSRLRQKLILSCQVILYIERVMNCTLNL